MNNDQILPVIPKVEDALIEPADAVGKIRVEIERLGGTVGSIMPNARWIQLNGVFTPEQLRRLAKAIEKAWKDRS